METDFLLELSHEEFYDVMLNFDHEACPDSIRQPQHKVHGCATDVWICKIDNKIVYDSTGAFVKGVVGTMLEHIKNYSEQQITDLTMSDFPFLIPSRISMRRMRGFDMALNKIKQLHQV